MPTRRSIIESLLFVYGEPLPIRRIGKILELGEGIVREHIKELKEDYEKGERGLRLIELDDKIQLVTAPENFLHVDKLIQSGLREDLTSASLETLAIIAYRGPISRAGLEHIRGVDSSFIIRRLLVKGLIDREEHPHDHRIHLYKITFNFLKNLGLNKIEDLPQFNELKRNEEQNKNAEKS